MDEPKLAVASLPCSDTEYGSIDRLDKNKIVVLLVHFARETPRRPGASPQRIGSHQPMPALRGA